MVSVRLGDEEETKEWSGESRWTGRDEVEETGMAVPRFTELCDGG